jgi:hypothetical protein
MIDEEMPTEPTPVAQPSKYWAAAPPDEIASKLLQKTQDYFYYLRQSGRMWLYQNAYQMYYGPALQGGQVQFSGQQGELVLISVNHYRTLLKNLHTLITTNRPALQCRATNTDHKSQAQCILGQGLVDYYLREKDLEYYLDTATEIALAYSGEGFVASTWNATLGEKYGVNPQTQGVIYQGDIEYRAYGPLEYIRDFSRSSPKDHFWGMTIDWVNKYELAAKYPEYADDITNLDEDMSLFEDYQTFRNCRQTMFGTLETDSIPMFTFYHKKSDALPQGRMVVYLTDTITLFDGPIPYNDVPVKRVAAGEWLGTPFGYTVGFDLMPMQQMSDSLHSAICTNQNASAVNNFWTKKGDTPDTSMLAGGLRSIQSDEKPEVLNLLQTAAETYSYEQRLQNLMESVSNMNAAARGNPDRDMSGSAMALLQATAIQFSSYLQKTYIKILEDCGTQTRDLLRVFAQVPRIAAIVGKFNQQYMKEFVGDDIGEVNRVMADVGNPILNTTAGKVDLADKFMRAGWLSDPEQYLMVYTTGRVEPLLEAQQAELMNIREENEMISNGEVPPVLISDNHPLHVKEHRSVTFSKEARSNPQIMQAFTAHVQEHVNLFGGHADPMTGQWIPGISPIMAGMLGIPTPPDPMAGMAPQTEEGGQPAPQGGNGASAPANEGPKSGPAEAAGVKNPKLPKLPPGTPAQTQGAAMGLNA